jgi:type IV pilus assembly protein PilB
MDPNPAQPLSQANGILAFVLQNAVSGRVSDIHIEPTPDATFVRYRVDGFLYPFQSYSKESHGELVAQIKVLCKLDSAEKRLPQDGHFDYELQNTSFSLRVSFMPTQYGEAVVLRILNRQENLTKLDALGLDHDQLETIRTMISNPSGMILTTGPTGSGKTSLLYSMISDLISPQRNIVTIEDPIELQMKGIRQTQINAEIGLDFAKVLRSMLRQDPDVVMIGEIRDQETAQMAVQAALSGILILSSFHTFDLPALIARLTEMGITSSVVAQSIKGVISSRLVRIICPHCKINYSLNEAEKMRLKSFDVPSGIQSQFVKGKGCGYCQNRGYIGRTGVFEVIRFDEDLKSAIIEKRSPTELYELLNKKMQKSLKYTAMEKVYLGMTTFEEVIRVVGV